MSAEADGEIPFLIVVVLRVEHAVQHLRQGGTHLSVAQVFGQLLIPSHEGQRLHGSHAVGRAATDDGEGALGRNEAFEDNGVFLCPLQGPVPILRVVDAGVGLGIGHGLKGLKIHGMEDIARIVVEGESRPVGIPAVAHIPFLHLAAGRIHPEFIVRRAGFGHETLDGGREKKPVGVGRIYFAQGRELLDVALFGGLVERHPQTVVGPEKTLGDIGRVDKILPRDSPT